MSRAFEGSTDTSDAGSLFQLSQDSFLLLLSDSPRLWVDGEGFVAGVASCTLRPGLSGSVFDDVLGLLAVRAGNAKSDHSERLPDFNPGNQQEKQQDP
jgi:hypothetical protein